MGITILTDLVLEGNSLDDYLLTNPSRTHRKEGFSASFVMPKLNSPRSPPSLVDLAARRIANEIIQENPPAALDNHEMLTDLPEHLQTITKSLVLETRAERAATKQREYCVDALKDISRFAVFDPRAVAKDSPPWPEGFVKRVEELSRNNGWNLGGGGGWGWGGIRNAKILYPPEHTFYDWRESESHYEDLDLGSDTISEVGVDSPSSRYVATANDNSSPMTQPIYQILADCSYIFPLATLNIQRMVIVTIMFVNF